MLLALAEFISLTEGLGFLLAIGQGYTLFLEAACSSLPSGLAQYGIYFIKPASV